ncbi:hypothetical protein B0T42_12545 [Rathayibacter sp. VKM Ac-2630]|nr:hypothetical protein B0T42_12545 [Rathayibacter sp. VKM Ac-2630]
MGCSAEPLAVCAASDALGLMPSWRFASARSKRKCPPGVTAVGMSRPFSTQRRTVEGSTGIASASFLVVIFTVASVMGRTIRAES